MEKEMEHQAALGLILLCENPIYQGIMLLKEPRVVGFVEMGKSPKCIELYPVVFIEGELVKLFLPVVVLLALCHDAYLVDIVHIDLVL